MQANGNLAFYDENDRVIFESKTAGRGDNAALDNDGGIKVYDSNGQTLWTIGFLYSN